MFGDQPAEHRGKLATVGQCIQRNLGIQQALCHSVEQ